MAKVIAYVDAAAHKAYFLLLAECAPDNCFGALRWVVTPTREPISVVARRGQRQLFIVAGRQVSLPRRS